MYLAIPVICFSAVAEMRTLYVDSGMEDCFSYPVKNGSGIL